MNTSAVPPMGRRIREERVRRGATVRGLAGEIGVSASLISQIENDKSQPSVSTLYAITTALGISIEDLFAPGVSDEAAEPEPVAAPQATPTSGTDGQRHMSTRRAARPGHRRRVGPVVHPHGREALTLETGVVWELLGEVPDVHVDFLLVTYQPGGASSTMGTLMRHTGTEFGYLISGELVLTLGFNEHHLHPGDAISFDSSTPHGYRNEGAEPAVGVWFVLE
ncbi:cupin domain-containing protein [Phytoactinopolyspora endophytica]|uniref:cupin domain-containing protein n=1 Tax=Phytoactinopolyspora endophytica TaxID=1642495 RepID=UPI00101D820C|nr:cupin domain-containing protein [Phytoactinopolyspora endophytica]